PLRYLPAFPPRRSSDLLIAGVQERHDAVCQCFGRSGGHDDFGTPVIIEAVEAPVVVGYRLPQFRDALHGRILVGAFDKTSCRLLDRKSTRLNSSHVKIS